MCSVQEGEELKPESKKSNIVNKTECMKCGETPVILIREGDPFCRECFQSYCTHKFRSAFGKSKLVRDGETVVMAFSGGQASSAMVHLVQEGLSKRAQKKLRFKPILVYVDESPVLSIDESEDAAKRSEIEQLLSASGLPYKVTSIEKAMQTTPGVGEFCDSLTDETKEAKASIICDSFSSLQICPDALTCLRRINSLFSSSKTLTAKESLLQTLRTCLLAEAARELGVGKVVLGDCATRQAVQMISGITQGQGAHTPLYMAFADKRFPDICLLRPLREFTCKEVAMYCSLNKLQPVFLPSFSTMAGSRASIDLLTETFVNGLQAEFPATTSKICRAGDKLEMPTNLDASVDRCALCQFPLDTDTASCSALAATMFSHQMSNKTETDTSSASPAGCVQENLCYGCRVVVRDLKTLEYLPENVTTASAKKMSSDLMVLPSMCGECMSDTGHDVTLFPQQTLIAASFIHVITMCFMATMKCCKGPVFRLTLIEPNNRFCISKLILGELLPLERLKLIQQSTVTPLLCKQQIKMKGKLGHIFTSYAICLRFHD